MMTNPSNDSPIHRSPYRAYLVRLWQDAPDSPWRASAQSVQSGEVVRFGSLRALFTFLETETRDATTTYLDDERSRHSLKK